jgi:hypothetical protein
MSDDTRGSIAVPDDAAVLDRIEVGPEGAAHAVLLVGPHEVELGRDDGRAASTVDAPPPGPFPA